MRTLVVINADSDQSLEAGRYYAELRGIPDRNILHLDTTNRINIDLAAYSNEIEGPVHAYISNADLSNQIDTVVFSMDFPYRVVKPPSSDQRKASLTACMYYGFYSSPNAFSFGCQIESGSEQDYFEAEKHFDRSGPLISNRYYMSAMITASNLANAKSLIRRSMNADYSSPSARVYLLRTDDKLRWVQWKEYGEALFLSEFTDVPQERLWVDASAIIGQTNLFGVTAGQKFHPWINNNTILPGAFAEHLTSYGGNLFDQIGNQMSILDWVFNGFSGAYGTIVEPCAFTNKFVSPRLHYWYARGFSMGESLWMSVRNPYQGIFVGDPLCAPYATPSFVSWVGITNYQLIAGSVDVTASVASVSSAFSINHVSMWRNGRYSGIVTNVPPAPGNIVTVVINGSNRSYTVTAGDTIFSLAENLTEEINSSPDLGVTASASGDRVVIKQDALGVDADGWTCAALVSAGTASVTTVYAHVPSTNFLESILPAREGLSLSGTSKSGDVVRATITRLDGVPFTNEYTVTANGTTPFTIISGLGAIISADINLQSTIGCLGKNADTSDGNSGEMWLFSRTNTWEGVDLFVDYEVDKVGGSTLSGPDFADNFNDNASVLGARATIFISAGATQLNPVVSMDTTNWPDGPHEIVLTAREGTSVGTETRDSVMLVVSNHDVTCTVNNPAGGIYMLKSGVITVDVSTAISVGSVTQLILYVEGKSVATGVLATLSKELLLDNYGAGRLNIQAHAYADGGRETLSVITSIQLFTDNDGDAVADQWECENFGSTTNYTGESDADGDGCNNYKEFISDTEPTNNMSYLRIVSLDEDLSISFDTSAHRRYQIRLNGELIVGIWNPEGAVFPGTGGSVVWTNVPPATNALRFYAVEPMLPQ